jgi:hypothetical protein
MRWLEVEMCKCANEKAEGRGHGAEMSETGNRRPETGERKKRYIMIYDGRNWYDQNIHLR